MDDEPATVLANPAIESLTTAVTLRLLTAQGAVEGLKRLGFDWAPEPYLPATKDAGVAGMYAWCDGLGTSPKLLDRGVLYFGIGRSAQGVLDRLREEESWKADAGHGHGITMGRRAASPVVGAVTFRPDADLDWLDELPRHADVHEDAPAQVRAWLESPSSPLQKAERLAIRLSIHAGDVASPVNTQFASGWGTASKHGSDWAAYCVAMQLRRKA